MSDTLEKAFAHGNASAMRAALESIEDLCKVLDRTDLWEARDREEWLDDAIYYIRKEACAAIKETEQC